MPDVAAPFSPAAAAAADEVPGATLAGPAGVDREVLQWWCVWCVCGGRVVVMVSMHVRRLALMLLLLLLRSLVHR